MKIKIPKKFMYGGLPIRVLSGGQHDLELLEARYYGSYTSETRQGRHIKINSMQSEVELSETFIHECLEMIKGVNCLDSLPHDSIGVISHGLHEIFEKMGLRFTL